jgi:hypothetical protein
MSEALSVVESSGPGGPPAIVLLTSDLACSSKVAGAALRHAVRLEMALSAEAALVKAAGCKWAVIDLATPSLVLADLVARLREVLSPRGRILAFGPHVLESVLEQAAAAGCDEVLTRGQFHARLDELLALAARP